MNFPDHFSASSTEYRDFRPSYPAAIFDYLVTLSPQTKCVWDCATGSGQAAVALTRYFTAVIATDASAKQIANARAADGVEYRVASAEASGIVSHSVDLITVAQALHWFDLEAFASEVMRVSKPNGILAALTYNLLTINQQVDAVIQRLYAETLAPYWPAERRMVENAYADVQLPFTELPDKTFAMGKSLSVQAVLGYLQTWSAVHQCAAKLGHNPVDDIAQELEAAWGSTGVAAVTWPITLKLWKIAD